MKYLLAIALLLTSCSGGGNDSPNNGMTCRTYCSFACAKALNCLRAPASLAGGCFRDCLAETQRLGRDDSSCANTQIWVQTMSCRELLQTLGLARTDSAAIVGVICGNLQ